MPAIDVTLTMAPWPRSRMPGRSAWIIRTDPKTFVSNIRRTSSSGTDSIGPSTPNPALLTSTSIGPASATAAATDASESTSRARRRATSRSWIVSGRRAVATTSYPRSVSSMAVARPIPVEHPVMRARFDVMVGTVPTASAPPRAARRRRSWVAPPLWEVPQRPSNHLAVLHRRAPAVRQAPARAVVTAVGGAQADSYDDDAYRQHDLDNMERTSGASADQVTDPAYLQQLAAAGAETELANLGEQLADCPAGRLYGGLGQLLPGGAVGDPTEFHELEPIEVNFLSRTGAKLDGRLFWDGEPGPTRRSRSPAGRSRARRAATGGRPSSWPPTATSCSPGTRRARARARPSATRPAIRSPTGDGVPSQQAANFVDSTVDAIRFLLRRRPRPTGPTVDRRRTCRRPRGDRGVGRGDRLAQPAARRHRPDPARHRRALAGRQRGVDRRPVQRPVDALARGRGVPRRRPAPDPRRRRLGRLSAGDDVRAGRPRHEPAGRRLLPQPAADPEAPDPRDHLADPRRLRRRRRRHLLDHRPRRHPRRVELHPAHHPGDELRHRHRRLLHARLVRPLRAPVGRAPARGHDALAHRARPRRPRPAGPTSGRGGRTSCRPGACRPSASTPRAIGAARCTRPPTCAPTRGCRRSATGPAPTPTRPPPAPAPSTRVRTSSGSSRPVGAPRSPRSR